MSLQLTGSVVGRVALTHMPIKSREFPAVGPLVFLVLGMTLRAPAVTWLSLSRKYVLLHSILMPSYCPQCCRQVEPPALVCNGTGQMSLDTQLVEIPSMAETFQCTPLTSFQTLHSPNLQSVTNWHFSHSFHLIHLFCCYFVIV